LEQSIQRHGDRPSSLAQRNAALAHRIVVHKTGQQAGLSIASTSLSISATSSAS
jgi:hypothetical protein